MVGVSNNSEPGSGHCEYCHSPIARGSRRWSITGLGSFPAAIRERYEGKVYDHPPCLNKALQGDLDRSPEMDHLRNAVAQMLAPNLDAQRTYEEGGGR